jgi:hypothetical protein
MGRGMIILRPVYGPDRCGESTPHAYWRIFSPVDLSVSRQNNQGRPRPISALTYPLSVGCTPRRETAVKTRRWGAAGLNDVPSLIIRTRDSLKHFVFLKLAVTPDSTIREPQKIEDHPGKEMLRIFCAR